MAGPENTAWIRGHGFPLASPCLVVGAASGQARQGGQALGLRGAYLREEAEGRQMQAGSDREQERVKPRHRAPWGNENREAPDGAQLMHISSQEKAKG